VGDKSHAPVTTLAGTTHGVEHAANVAWCIGNMDHDRLGKPIPNTFFVGEGWQQREVNFTANCHADILGVRAAPI
jgi:hypothetical protein